MTAAPHRNYPSQPLRRLLELHRRWIETAGKHGGQLTDESAGSNFSGLHLDGVCFRGARLVAAQFVGCSLAGADFSNADLHGSLFRDSNLTNAKFDEADLDFSAFGNNQMEGASFDKASVHLANIPSRTRRLTAADFEL
jgi:uncharacterized protein YjbI with pentapeptide repeats